MIGKSGAELYDLFVAHGVTVEEIAAMDPLVLCVQMHELRIDAKLTKTEAWGDERMGPFSAGKRVWVYARQECGNYDPVSTLDMLRGEYSQDGRNFGIVASKIMSY